VKHSGKFMIIKSMKRTVIIVMIFFGKKKKKRKERVCDQTNTVALFFKFVGVFAGKPSSTWFSSQMTKGGGEFDKK
jgi:hypothetical protein